MITVIVVALALCAVLLFYVAVRSRRKHATLAIRPVDLKAFRTLMDRDDELFLRAQLPRGKFFRLKRQRIRVTLGYVGRIAANASAVLRMTEASRQSAAPEVATAAAQVMELATQIRMQCLLAMGKLCFEYVVPSLQFTPAMLVPKYQSLRDNWSRLGQLQVQNRTPLASAI
ncbi:MAG TPA: hypothetical protein VKQ89_03780 [Candidatus Angelobacter sp.]|nr:hypothetical protein [Candidatus Angelobacter sp.]